MTVGRTDHHSDLEAVMVGVADPHTRRYCSPFDWSGDSSRTGGGMTVGLVDHHTASAYMMVVGADHHKTSKSGADDENLRKRTARGASCGGSARLIVSWRITGNPTFPCCLGR